ncbi:MAG: hypothetical protein HY822_09815 [Acidobacteria bacterium]|nr:hypothetical protein [Acidobacteriota bacterium]
MNQIASLTGKPTMVTEFSFKAMDSGLPNTKGAAKPVATQQERASSYGVVKLDGSPWETLVARMKEVNARIESRAAKAQLR